MRAAISSRLCGLALGLAALVAASCAGTDIGDVDASAPGNYRLEIAFPPGESLGLGPTASATLAVRYLSAEGAPVAGAEVSFALLATASEESAGSTLSSERALTNAVGVAEVTLVAAAERTSFRVEVSAAAAPSVFFYIGVSDRGFSDLIVSPRHGGARDVGSFASLQFRLYRAVELRCASLDIEAPPASLFPLRSSDSFAPAVRWRNLPADAAYTIVAWAAGAPGTPLAAGCVDLGAEAVRAGREIRLELAVDDLELRLPAVQTWVSRIDLAPLRSALPGASLWRALACPLGPAQLLIDCALDAASPGVLDCIPDSGDPLAAALADARGSLAGGCRGATAGGAPSLEAALAAEMGAGPWPADGALGLLWLDVIGELQLVSEVQRSGPETLRHTLLRASQSVGLIERSIDLVASARPVVTALGVLFTSRGDQTFTLGEHRFSLWLGELLERAFVELALAPLGLQARQGDLGNALLETVDGAAAPRGCASLDALVCPAADAALGCLGGCPGVAAHLNASLEAWLSELAREGLDVTLRGSGTVLDTDGDRQIDGFGGGATLRIDITRQGGGGIALGGRLSVSPP